MTVNYSDIIFVIFIVPCAIVLLLYTMYRCSDGDFLTVPNKDKSVFKRIDEGVGGKDFLISPVKTKINFK